MTPAERKFKSRKASIMGIIVNLDVMMAKRKISLTELANQVDLTQANLSILKSPTVMRQHDGRLWCWEGNNDSSGSCHGTCTHVWNYVQALPHLFPDMERTLRETEFMVDQDSRGHQTFRANLPIRPVEHGFHAACDGQFLSLIHI